MREVDPSRWLAQVMARRWHAVVAGIAPHAGVLGVSVVAATVVVAAGAISLQSAPVGLSLPRAATVAPHAVTRPVSGSGSNTDAVTVVAPRHPVDIFDEQAGASSRTGGSTFPAPGGTTGVWSGTNDSSHDGAGPMDPTATIDPPPDSTTPTLGITAGEGATTTTTQPGHNGGSGSDNGTSDDSGWHGGTTTTSPRSGGSGGTTTSTTKVDR